MRDEEWMDLAVEAGQLREAMAHRAAIEQAKGVIMGMRRCSADEAFGELRTVSQRRNIKLHALASALVLAAGNPLPLPEQVDPAVAEVVARNWLSAMAAPVAPVAGSDAGRAWSAPLARGASTLP